MCLCVINMSSLVKCVSNLFKIFVLIIHNICTYLWSACNILLHDRKCNHQVRAFRITITSSIYHFSMLGTFQVLSSSYFTVCNKLLLTIDTLLCYQHQKLNQSLFTSPTPQYMPFPSRVSIILLLTFVRLMFIPFMCEWEHTLFVFLCLSYFN